jgi:hypothetical protein
MTRKELFYSLLSKKQRIIALFNYGNIFNYLKSNLDDSVYDNRDSEIIIEAEGNEYNTKALLDIASSLEKQVFSANKSLAAHSFDKTKRQDSNIRFTVKEDKENYATSITVSSYQRSRWSKVIYDYDNGGLSTLYIAYEFYFWLDEDFNLVEAQITFIDLDELSFNVYPEII